MAVEGDEAGELLIEVPLEVNTSRASHLGLLDCKASASAPSKAFRPDSNQLLTQGASLGSKLQSRLKLVRFGRHSGSPACLLLLSIDFKPKSYTGVLRFRDATIEVQVQPGKGGESPENISTADTQRDDGKKEPTIVAWHPGYLEGPAKSILEKFNFSVDTSAIPAAFGAPVPSPGFGYSMSRERVKRRIIHGTIEDEKQRVLEWRLEENKGSGDGIPPACKFAFIVKVELGQGFRVKLGFKAITVAAIPVIGKNTGAIYFAPDQFADSTAADTDIMNAWTSAVRSQVSMDKEQDIDLAQVNLAALTQAEWMIKDP